MLMIMGSIFTYNRAKSLIYLTAVVITILFLFCFCLVIGGKSAFYLTAQKRTAGIDRFPLDW